MTLQLTRQQLNFFEVFGYLKLPGLYRNQAHELQSAFDSLFREYESLDYRHPAHYNKARHIIFNAVERNPTLRKLITAPDIENVFSQLLGNDYSYTASEANIFTGDTYWHSDIYGCHFKYRYAKALFYLDPLTATTGAICVIPGSHLFGDKYANKLNARVWEHEQHLGINKEEVPHVAIETQPGDVILFDFRIKHATINHANTQRRMFTLCGAQRFATEDEEKLLSTFLDIKKLGASVHNEEFIKTLSEKERYRIEQTLAIHEQNQLHSY